MELDKYNQGYSRVLAVLKIKWKNGGGDQIKVFRKYFFVASILLTVPLVSN